MSETPRILTAEQMRAWYGTFYDQSPMIKLDPSKVPPRFWHLLPYAELWGVADDCLRENLVTDAPSAVRQNLRDVVMPFDRALDDWLAGPEADTPEPSEEYIAYSAMRMAADFA